MPFHPTALLVMEHKITGMKYFCKTSRIKTICGYKGSGIYWKKHLAKHGKDVTVGLLGFYVDEQRCRDAALKFSTENNIVKSNDWANCIAENGIDGAPIGEAHPLFGKPSKCIGQKRPWVGKSGADNPMWGKPSPMRGIEKPKGKDSPLYGRKRPDGGGKPAKPIIATDKNGVKIRFASMSEAEKFVGGSRSEIRKCCQGVRQEFLGYKWQYELGSQK